jgi:hypothetical protein
MRLGMGVNLKTIKKQVVVSKFFNNAIQNCKISLKAKIVIKNQTLYFQIYSVFLMFVDNYGS